MARDLCLCLDFWSIPKQVARIEESIQLSDLSLFGCVSVEAEAKITLPGADGEEVGRKETMELFPQSAGLGAVQDAAASDAARYWTKLLSSTTTPPCLAVFSSCAC